MAATPPRASEADLGDDETRVELDGDEVHVEAAHLKDPAELAAAIRKQVRGARARERA